jgi:hypothetical protein
MKYPILALLAAFSITASADSINLNSSRSNPPTAADRLGGKPTKDQVVQPDEATTIKSSKSNSSERLGKPSKDQVVQPVEATTIKSSKSNSSDRLGKPSKEQVVQPAEATTVKGSKCNSDYRTQRNPTVTHGIRVSREKAPDVTPGPTQGKEGSNAEAEKPFKF